ncbi:WD40 repeat domain-containing serine/threonine protein kinase [Streptosporangium roseum]|uniref:Serine/threonine protein kinase-like protein n=1 Tax=Streptosporangium roseum (strain ATCC 12428 / DSM 43021 / JCM 3005 / KCTC 9067 / NCIMB 10171 / NRRL 2505 / NI 9100) TaxID=479432 RepID=D2B6A8_STRRD|nr:serine/threonine-protein kinase [Streptosporangium roseum]ACZ83821.1 Serine/threonine protein kinase-like protein [Streptosporangium roseum DSM 43021]
MGLTALAPGDPVRLGAYRLAGRLGAGGQGVVYEAYDAEGGRAAIKVLHGDVAADPRLRTRFMKEAEAARRVASFCTARILAVDFDAPRPYIVSEFVAGPDLRGAVREAGPYAGDALHRLAIALATALTAIHRAGVVHRDVKPENVLLGPDGPRVIDFGVARTGEMPPTTTGIVTGTPTYMAPEVFVGQRAGAPADVFAWGGVLLFAATGKDPFQAETLGGVMHRVLTVDPDLGDVAEPLRSLMAAALAKEATGRPTAHELLTGLLGGAAVTAGPPAVRETGAAGGPAPATSAAEDGGAGGEGTEDGVAADLVAGARAARGVLPAGSGAPALGVVAEEAFAGLPPEAQADAPGVLLRMIGDDSIQSIDYRPEDEPVIARFADAGLLVREGATVVPAGAALSRAWPRLREWLAAERDGLPVHRRLAEAARVWEERGRLPGDLYQGASLREALHWAATERRYLGMNRRERQFLDMASAVERRRQRGRRLVTAGMAVLLVFSLGVTAIALRQRQTLAGQAEDLGRQRDESAARAAAARADDLRDSDPGTAMRLSVAAWRIAQVPEARSALQAALAQAKIDVFTDPDATSRASYVLTPDARTLVRAYGGEVRMYDVATHRPVRSLRGVGDRAAVTAASSDGSILQVGERLWDSTTGKAVGPAIPEGARAELEPERRLLSITGPDGLVMRPLDGGGPLVSATGTEPEGTVSPDGRWAAVAGRQGTVEVWDLAAGRRAFSRKIDGPVSLRGERGAPQIAFSPDSATLAVGGDTSIVLLDPAGGKQRGEHFPSTGGGSLGFSPDGRFLAEQADDALYLWKVADRTISAQFPLATFGRARFTADSRTLRYPTDYGSVVSVDISAVTHTDTLNVPKERSGWESAAFAPGGRVLAYANLGVARLWDPTRLAPIGGPLTADAGSAGMFSPDGRTLAIPRRDGSAVTLWDVTTRRSLTTLETGAGPVMALAFSGDGRTLAAGVGGGGGKEIQIWDVRAGRITGTVPRGAIQSLAFRPGGDPVGGRDGGSGGEVISVGAELVALPGGRTVSAPAGVSGPDVQSAAFTPDGRVLALGLADQRVLLWDVERGARLGVLSVKGLQQPLRFSPDGRVLVTAGDGVRLWDTATQREIGALPLAATALDLAFSPDGRVLNAVARDGSVSRLPVEPSMVAESVCARVGSGLSAAEWERLIPGIPYRETCGR